MTTSLTKDPFAILVQKLFNHSEFPMIDSVGNIEPAFPRSNIRETTSSYIIELGLSGWKREEIKVELSSDELIITGESSTQPTTEGRYIRRELKRSKFAKKFILDHNIDRDKIEATYTDGLLIVTIPKITKKYQVNRTIEIK